MFEWHALCKLWPPTFEMLENESFGKLRVELPSTGFPISNSRIWIKIQGFGSGCLGRIRFRIKKKDLKDGLKKVSDPYRSEYSKNQKSKSC